MLISLSATLRENGWTDLHEIFREGVEWPWDDRITFWVNSGKPHDAAMLISLSATLRENGWTDLHEIFREDVEWPWDNLITFWIYSGKPRDAAMLISLTATLRENGDLAICDLQAGNSGAQMPRYGAPVIHELTGIQEWDQLTVGSSTYRARRLYLVTGRSPSLVHAPGTIYLMPS